MEFYAKTGNLEIPAGININELYKKAYELGVEQKSAEICRALDEFKELLKKLGVESSSDIGIIKEKINYIKRRTE